MHQPVDLFDRRMEQVWVLNPEELLLRRKPNMPKACTTASMIFVSVGEVSASFGVSPKSVYRLLERDLLKSSSALRHKLILKISVDEFIAATVQNGGAR